MSGSSHPVLSKAVSASLCKSIVENVPPLTGTLEVRGHLSISLGTCEKPIALTINERIEPSAAGIVIWFVMAGILYVHNKPTVLEITRHQGAQETIALAEQLAPASDGRPMTLMALWGNDYWQLAYAQAYQNHFPNLNIVDHNANFVALLEQNHHLMTLSRTFYERSLDWWQETLGSAHLSSVAPGIIEISKQPQIRKAETNHPSPFILGNGIVIQNATLSSPAFDTLLLTINWEAKQNELPDYSIAIHLVTQDPPTAPQDILAQADRAHPVDGWYPTSRWVAGEVVRDHYLLTIPPDAAPIAVRVSMYQALEDGQFINSEWLSLPVPVEGSRGLPPPPAPPPILGEHVSAPHR